MHSFMNNIPTFIVLVLVRPSSSRYFMRLIRKLFSNKNIKTKRWENSELTFIVLSAISKYKWGN